MIQWHLFLFLFNCFVRFLHRNSRTRTSPEIFRRSLDRKNYLLFPYFFSSCTSQCIFWVSQLSRYSFPLCREDTRSVSARNFLRKHERFNVSTREQKRIFYARVSTRLAPISFPWAVLSFPLAISVLHIYCRGSTLISSVVIIVTFVWLIISYASVSYIIVIINVIIVVFVIVIVDDELSRCPKIPLHQLRRVDFIARRTVLSKSIRVTQSISHLR